ncbi:Integral membrane protein [hydrothermal vent metagenome]|uniref:Integral membrane protein n=1 Tax=hydrothermal vent metagenome TaxID=652676 RepID=A0A3B0V1X5_9ZZZZ
MLKSLWQQPAVRHSLLIFVVLRLFLSVWAVVVLAISPLPETPRESRRPYLDQPILTEGTAGLLLAPWQRFDGLHYTRIAAQGYAAPEDSVFPPLYPWTIRLISGLFGGSHAAQMAAAILISNASLLGLLILLYKVGSKLIGPEHAPRLLIYFILFPTGSFLFAPYSESLFLLLALGSLWLSANHHLKAAGLLGLLAALTRLTGWVLVVPLAYQFWCEHLGQGKWKMLPKVWSWRTVWTGTAVFLPPLGLILFIVYRHWLGLPPLSNIYTEYWFQRTGIPGADMLRAARSMAGLGPGRTGEFTLWFDFFITALLLATTIWAWRRWRHQLEWPLYATMLLLFMLLPTSELKPLYSFSRYALAFFPTFLLLAEAGKNGIIHRLILYPSLLLYLYFSAQFFIWGWVA